MSRRTEKISEQLRADVSRVLRESVSDPRIGLVTLTRVDVAPDLSHAVVYWSALDPKGGASVDLDGIQDGLESAASFLRREIAKISPLKRTPALRFRYDPSIASADETLAILRRLKDGA